MAERVNRRRYEDGCGAAHALELIGERWALLVARELMLGPRRFTDLRAGLPAISPNVLTQRLEEMEAASIVRRRRLPPPGAARVWELTEWGLELEPILRDIGRWAARSPALTPGPMSVNSVILSFRTMFDPARAGDFRAEIELRFADWVFAVRVADGAISIEPGPAAAPRAIVSGDQNLLAAVVYGGLDLAEALAGGGLAVTGDRDLVTRFAGLFPLPARAPAVVASA